MVVSLGASYGFLFSACFGSLFIRTHLGRASVPAAVSASSDRRGGNVGIQDGQDLLRSCPGFDIDFFIRDAARRLDHGVVLDAAGAEFAVSVRWNVKSERGRTKMGDVTEKGNRALAVAVLQFAVGRTHSAERLDAALHALRHRLAFTTSKIEK